MSASGLLPKPRRSATDGEWWMAPSIAARRVDGVRRPLVPRAAPGDGSLSLEREPVPSTALLPPDERVRKGREDRCAAEIRSATYILAQAR